MFGLRGSVHIVDTTCKEVEKRVAPRAPILAPGEDVRTALNVSETSPEAEACRAKPAGRAPKRRPLHAFVPERLPSRHANRPRGRALRVRRALNR